MTIRHLLPASLSSALLVTILGMTTSLLIACSTSKVEDDQKQARAQTKVTTVPQDTVIQNKAPAKAQSVDDATVTGSRVSSESPAIVAKQKARIVGRMKAAAMKPSAAFNRSAMDYFGLLGDRENYRHRNENSFKIVQQDPVSTFSIDVDSASYANARRFLNNGTLPYPDAIRSEEFVNYFNYEYPNPDKRSTPFSITTEVAPSPWAEGRHLLHVGLKGYDVEMTELPPANLVFLVDVSGSMNSPNKLGLLKTSLKLLIRSLKKKDTVSIVVYAGASGVALEPTPGNETLKIEAALDRLQAGGSTNGGAGIQLAYNLAKQNFNKKGINRVILATDGDFNVGVVGTDALKELVKRQRNSGIELTTLGFGTGNYNDELMNELAEIGNGNSAYIDTALEARKALVEELSSTLFTIAKDVKIQIEFSPQVAEYRLIGYESRLLNREDFNNDKIDAGEIGAGHTVTALYELVLKESKARTMDPLRYDHGQSDQKVTDTNELAYLKLRYKLPDQTASTLVEQPIKRSQIISLKESSQNFRWSAAVAAFAQQLAGSNWVSNFSYDEVWRLGKGAIGNDNNGYRMEMLKLVKMADTLTMVQTNNQTKTDAPDSPGIPGARTRDNVQLKQAILR